MNAEKKVGPKRKRVLDAINHRTPDRVPMDFGGLATTGIHVSCVAALREHYRLEKRPVKVCEPFQMLGLIEDDLKEAIGIDVTALMGRTNMFGFENSNWRPWTFNGLDVLVPEGFRTTVEPDKGGTLIYPKGDMSVRPSGHMPKGGFFFDSIIRRKGVDFDQLDPNDNTEQYQPLSAEQLDAIEEDARAVNSGEYAVFASLVNTALGDIAFVPAPDLVEPKGVRDVAEWYMLTASRPDIVHKVFERQVEVGIENLAKIHRRVGDAIDVIFLCGADFGTQTSSFCSVKAFGNYLWKPHYADICGWIYKNTTWKTFKHTCGSSGAILPVDDRRRDRHHESGPVLCEGDGPAHAEGKIQRASRVLGGGVDTQRRCPSGRRPRCAPKSSNAAKSFRRAADSYSTPSTTFKPTPRLRIWSRCLTR